MDVKHSLAKRAARAIEKYSLKGVAYILADRCLEFLLTRYSVLCFRVKSCVLGVEVGRKVEVFGRVIVRRPTGRISIGNHCQFISSSWRASAAAVFSEVRLRTFSPASEIIFEDGSGMSGGSVTSRSMRIRIGRNTLIAPNCVIVDSDFHTLWPPGDRGSYSGDGADAPIDIGANVWIGMNCIVLKGVTIGDNSVIAAGSVVTGSIPGNVLAGGVPAKVIRRLDADPHRSSG